MPRFEFRGRVRPEALPLSVDYAPTYERQENHPDIPNAAYTVRVTEGRVTVVAETLTEDVQGPDFLFIPALDFAGSLVQAAGFSMGVPFDVVFDEVELPDGRVQPVVFRDRRLAELCTVIADEATFEAVAHLVMTDLALGQALSDLLQSLARPHYSPISCGRVADSLVRMIAGGKGPKEWAQMREVLRVDEAYVKLLTDQSKPHRHGDRITVEAVVTQELAARAWTMMNRYIAFRLGGGSPLTDPEFPLLHG